MASTDSVPATGYYPPASSGSKEADDFIDQQAELIPHNAPARETSVQIPTEEGGTAKMKNEYDSEGTTVLQEGRTVTPTTPPINDVSGETLHSGDKDVVFVGACPLPEFEKVFGAEQSVMSHISRSRNGWDRCVYTWNPGRDEH
jgi:hypothetical protein